MKILGIIPARGGSKGIPGKNGKILGNKPLIAYSIEAAKKARLLTDFIVSTDDEEIARIARDWGARVPFLRPAELARDHTPTLPVVLHALDFFKSRNIRYDAVCLLQPTTPFRPEGFVDRAIEEFIRQDADSLVSVLPVPHEYNPHWVFEPGNDGFLHIATGDKEIIPRRQELPPAYFRDGSIYLTRTDVLEKKNSLYGERVAYILSDPARYVNLDTPGDWKRAEEMLNQIH